MKRTGFVLCTAVALAAPAAPLLAGPERIALPADYATTFERYNVVDRLDRKRVRYMYVNEQARAAAKAGEPAPDGTILVMEDHDAAVDGDGKLRRDDEGRLIPGDQVTGIFVMQKEAGWGDAYPADQRNGDWDYAVFDVATMQLKAEQKYEGCFACHMNRAGRDFTFTYFKNVADAQ